MPGSSRTALPALIRRATGAVVTGVVGVAVVRAAERRNASRLPRTAAVQLTAWGIRGARSAERGVERSRLAAGDVRAEAYAKLGEQAPPPAGRAADGHDHSS